jgi:hypothetical protein
MARLLWLFRRRRLTRSLRPRLNQFHPALQLRGGGSRRLIRAAAADLDRLQLLGCNQPVHAASAQPEHVVASAVTIGGFVIVFLLLVGFLGRREIAGIGFCANRGCRVLFGRSSRSHRRGPFGAGFCGRVI